MTRRNLLGRALLVGGAVAAIAWWRPLLAAPGGRALVEEVAKGVAKVGEVGSGKRGSMVLLLEESHNSRLQQFQHAIVLTRLYERNDLRDVALEGYLQDRPLIDFGPYSKIFAGATPVERAAVVVRLLKEGEISAVEFSALVYPDLRVHPTELKSTHDQEVTPFASKGMIGYLQKLAPVDSAWVNNLVEQLKNKEVMLSKSTSEQKDLYESIRNRAEQKGVAIPEDTREGMDEYIAFWRARAAADQVMFKKASQVADDGKIKLMAMNIGALHTKPQIKFWKDAGASFAVVSPLAKVNDVTKSDLPTAMYERKLKRLSVFDGGLSALIEKDGGAKKPETVLNERWFQAKAEIYAYVDRIARGAAPPKGPPKGPPGPPRGPTSPPFGFSGGDFDGKWISIDPAKVALVAASKDDKKNKAVLIPIVFKQSGATVWAKATLMEGQEGAARTVESILRGAMKEVEGESKTPERAEDDKGRVQISVDTFAGFARTVEAARLLQLTES